MTTIVLPFEVPLVPRNPEDMTREELIAALAQAEQERDAMLSHCAAKGDEPDLLIHFWRVANDRASAAEELSHKSAETVANVVIAYAELEAEVAQLKEHCDTWAADYAELKQKLDEMWSVSKLNAGCAERAEHQLEETRTSLDRMDQEMCGEDYLKAYDTLLRVRAALAQTGEGGQ